jgi:aspartyl/asparaginyl beta-hydroxylase (cupin superfamily)
MDRSAPGTIDATLARNPRDVAALIRKADELAAGGDIRGSSAYYLRAVRVASGLALTPELRREVARAQAACDDIAARIESGLRERLAQVAGGSERFRESLDILFGHRQPYFQQPQYYFFPGLPHVQFFDRGPFPWLEAVEAATPAIREEMLDVMRDPGSLQPYVRSDPSRPASSQAGMADNPDWSAYYLYKDGAPVAGHAERCPRTLAALKDVPFPRVRGRMPSILFSVLRPGAHIPAHNGFINTRLICHLPLVVPRGCTFRVGNEMRDWVEGKAWIFDDTIEHEAWNRSAETRVVLLFEVWRPELSAEERRLVAAMFEAIDSQGGERAAWSV